MEPITVTIGNIELEATPVNGVISDGEVNVESMYVELMDKQYLKVDEQILWDEDSVKESVRASWMEKGNWPDTSTSDWGPHSTVNQDTIKWDILEYMWDNQPTTNTEIDEALELDGATSAYVSKMKEDNLVKVVGYSGRSQVLVVTHVGAKELYSEYGAAMTDRGSEGNSGLSSLFSDTSIETGDGEEGPDTITEDDIPQEE